MGVTTLPGKAGWRSASSLWMRIRFWVPVRVLDGGSCVGTYGPALAEQSPLRDKSTQSDSRGANQVVQEDRMFCSGSFPKPHRFATVARSGLVGGATAPLDAGANMTEHW